MRSLALASALLAAAPCWAALRVVSDTGEFAAALSAAQPGDSIVLLAGVYDGGQYRAGLTDVTIRGDYRAETGEVIVRGGVNGVQLSDATGVTIEGITFEQQTGNGLNIDDGGSFATPSTDITIRDVVVRDLSNGAGGQATGNNDGIKLSGVTGFLIERVEVANWGDRGSAVDPVGSHHGVIQRSYFHSDTLTDNGSVVRPKGGSKAIDVRANLIELPNGAGRAMQAGGSTGPEFFRFIDGDSGYEASDINFYGNRVLGGASAMNWVNIDGGAAHHNDLRGPARWAMRILNENQGSAIVDTANGQFFDNYVAFDGDLWSRAVNVGAETDAASFTFSRNKWLNTADPTPGGSAVSLPAPETDGEFGVGAPWAADEPMRHAFEWGEWIVPLGASDAAIAVEDFGDLLYARAEEGARFDPLAADPLQDGDGYWVVLPARAVEETHGFYDFVLIRPEACSLCQTGIAGDYDYNGVLNTKDSFHWGLAYGYEGEAPLADGNGDGVVNAADYTLWRDAYDAGLTGTSVPEPSGATLVAMLLMWATSRKRQSVVSCSWFSVTPPSAS